MLGNGAGQGGKRLVTRDSGVSRKDFLTALPRHALGAMQSWAEEHLARWTPETLPTQRPGVAVIDVARCLAWGTFGCQSCYLACPRKGLAMEMIESKPVVRVSGCDGCAMCVTACRTVNDLSAIRVLSTERGGDHV